MDYTSKDDSLLVCTVYSAAEFWRSFGGPGA